jgi:hypothetical protein
MGKQLFAEEGLNSVTKAIDISGYAKGMYYITINNSVTKKIIRK